MKQLLLAICSVLSFEEIFGQSIVLDSSFLPVVIINTNGKVITDTPRIIASMKIIFNGSGKVNKVNTTKYHYDNNINIELRGNSSQFFPQKQYGFETKDKITKEDIKVALCGMPEEEDWILYAPYNDISLMRNVMTYELWRKMGHYAPRTQFCEVIMNNEYIGVYVLMEKIKRGTDRVDISKVKNSDTSGIELTGGYIMKIDKSKPYDKTFISKVKSTTGGNITWVYDEPGASDIHPKQAAYIQNYIDTVEQVIFSNKFADPEIGYRKYISVSSFIDYFLLTELSRNIDAYKASSYFYKEKKDSLGGKGQLKAGPMWDYNFAFGNASFCTGGVTTGWMYDGCTPATLPTPSMWRKLIQDTRYINDVKCRYNELRKTIWDTANLFKYLDSYFLDTLSNPQKRHYTKWKILGTNPGNFNAYIAQSYADEIRRIKNWLKARLVFMDGNLPGVCTTITTDTDVSSSSFKVYPNPSTGQIVIELPDMLQAKIATINILNSQGVIVKHKFLNKSERKLEINLEDITSGMYIVELITDISRFKEKLILIK